MRYLSRGTRKNTLHPMVQHVHSDMSLKGVNIEQYGLCETINPETGVLEVRLASEVDDEGRQKLLAMEILRMGREARIISRDPSFERRSSMSRRGRIAKCDLGG